MSRFKNPYEGNNFTYYSNYILKEPSTLAPFIRSFLYQGSHDDDILFNTLPNVFVTQIIVDYVTLEEEILLELPSNVERIAIENDVEALEAKNSQRKLNNYITDVIYYSRILPFIIPKNNTGVMKKLGSDELRDLNYITTYNASHTKEFT